MKWVGLGVTSILDTNFVGRLKPQPHALCIDFAPICELFAHTSSCLPPENLISILEQKASFSSSWPYRLWLKKLFPNNPSHYRSLPNDP